MRMAFDFNTTTAMLKQYDIITIAPMMKTDFLKQMVTKAEMLSDPEIAYIYSDEDSADGEHIIYSLYCHSHKVIVDNSHIKQ